MKHFSFESFLPSTLDLPPPYMDFVSYQYQILVCKIYAYITNHNLYLNDYYLFYVTLLICDCIWMIDAFFVYTLRIIIIFAAATINANLTSITQVAVHATALFLFICSAAVFSIKIRVLVT